MMIGHSFTYKYVVGAMLILGSVFAQAQTARTAITTTEVTAAMAERDLPVDGLQLKLAAQITATVANPQLEIQTVLMVNPHEARIRLACRNHSECLPFFATAAWPNRVEPIVLPTDLDRHSAGKPVTKAADAMTVRAGNAATLIIDGNRTHIRLEVICLQGGATGDKVRVTTRDHKVAYVAEIVNPTLLKGSL